MKLGEIYSVISLIFSSNFKNVPSITEFENINKTWLLRNETKENKIGCEFFKKVDISSYDEVCLDFKNLKSKFELDNYRLINETDIVLFFEKVRFQKPFKELKSSYSSNMLAFLSLILKNNISKQESKILNQFLEEYLLQSLKISGEDIKNNAKTDYYKAIGWLLVDFCNMIKISFNIEYK